jgi:hypothetical protein
MKKMIFEVFVCMLLIVTAVPAVSATENWIQVQKLIPSHVEGGADFGGTVSISGDTALVGAYYETNDSGLLVGAAYVFTRNGNTWTQQARLASDNVNYEYFGASVSLSGDTALIGAEGGYDSIGSVYVFTRTGTSWTQQAKLQALDSNGDDDFGWSVSLDGNTALIGAEKANGNVDYSGAAYVFTRTGTTWTQQAKLYASDDGGQDSFGYDVSLSGDTAIISTTNNSAHVFTRTGTTWTFQQKLTAPDNRAFGYPVSLDGNTALIGGVESVHVFTRSGTIWIPQAKLIASDNSAENIDFGGDVSLNGDTALIGAVWDDDNAQNAGAVYVFTRSGTTWTQQVKLLATDGAETDNFGSSVSLSGDTALIGAHTDESAYVFIKNSENQLSFADFTWTPSTPKQNQEITFDASASYVTKGSITVYEWDWDSDGVYDENSTVPTATHEWIIESNYPVTLRVTDTDGVTFTKKMIVPVSSVNGNDNTNGNGNTNNKGTPGFELVFIIGAIAVTLLLWRKKRNV